MDLVLRAVSIYLILLVIFRLAGRRTLANTSTFDFVLLLVISETVQQALTGGSDNSITGATILVSTLVGLDIALSFVKERFPRLHLWIDGCPLVLLSHGRVHEDRLRKARVTEDDILVAARDNGVGSLAEIEYAVLESSGAISIISKSSK